ncbi:AraC family transcriptional regulator [Rhodoferax sp. U11-2br]|uniref:AraC family transcriptional regulator n=1 Tax=Rhodoferax sp. U11-2br TaxID=2838878 RepID=UPI001BE5CE8A|nr:AraC family transcriptional regulator [Rhodoferax sp. U11-2br]MBT3067515.1 AraC family transcriptional regulator [Rhodoferax sp. U11-2br]
MKHPTERQHAQPSSVPPQMQAAANIVPYTARSLLGLVEDRGLSAERICRGLGFSHQDLQNREMLLSHLQVRSLILRAQKLLGEPALGLAAGGRQTPVSWGLPGLAMLTCETFGEAISYGLSRQTEAGAMMRHLFEDHGREMHLEVVPRIFDLTIEPFLIEESFAAALSVSRYLVGPSFKPVRVDLAFDGGAHKEVYTHFFRCPVRFDAGCNRVTLESHWLGARLPGYDRITCGLIREQLNSLLKQPVGRHDLVESLSNRIRFGIEDRPSQSDLSRQLNLSERSLRRRLDKQSVGFRGLRDAALFERARDLLQNSSNTIAEVAQAVGYSDARAFRRAFKRWSGELPTAFRARC